MGPPVFHKWFIEHFNTMTDMLSARRTYASSLAVMSIIGNIIGLGDRHCENIQICQKTGEVVHIDLNMIFERGNKLKVPEIVPFRMTREIVDGCGMVKLEGTFKAVSNFLAVTVAKLIIFLISNGGSIVKFKTFLFRSRLKRWKLRVTMLTN